jgi:hypothetical protein
MLRYSHISEGWNIWPSTLARTWHLHYSSSCFWSHQTLMYAFGRQQRRSNATTTRQVQRQRFILLLRLGKLRTQTQRWRNSFIPIIKTLSEYKKISLTFSPTRCGWRERKHWSESIMSIETDHRTPSPKAKANFHDSISSLMFSIVSLHANPLTQFHSVLSTFFRFRITANISETTRNREML